jgi:hypothetical protein
MAAYGRGDYTGGRYSYGAYLGEALVVSTSTVTAAGDRIKDGQFEVFSTSTTSIAGQRIATASASVVSASIMTAQGGLDAVGAVAIVSSSLMYLDFNRLRFAEAAIMDTSTVNIFARKKWEIEADVNEIWTKVSL